MRLFEFASVLVVRCRNADACSLYPRISMHLGGCDFHIHINVESGSAAAARRFYTRPLLLCLVVVVPRRPSAIVQAVVGCGLYSYLAKRRRTDLNLIGSGGSRQ